MSKLSVTAELQYTKVPTSEDKKDLDKEEVPETYGYGVRHAQLLILFLCVVMSFVARGHLGVTIVAMTNQVEDSSDVEDITTAYPKKYRDYNDSRGSIENRLVDITEYRANITDLESFSNTSLKSNLTDEARSLYSTFDWPKSIQEMVLTSFFSGYCLMMMPISLVCQRWGGKVPLQMSMFINGLMSILTPTLAYWGGWKAVCAGRLLQGAAQAGTYPAVQTLLAQWVPASEKSTLTSYVYTGATTGSVVGFQIGGMLSDVAGWPAAFWSIGSLCILMGALLTVFGAASPRVHRTISEKEKRFIIGQTQNTTVKSSRAPWKALLTSKPLLANYSTAVGSGVAFVFFFTQVPSYIHYIYGIDVRNSGMLSSLPYIVSIFASVAFGIISDYLINHKVASRKNVRRYSNLISQIGMASALLGASYASNTTVAVVWFVVFMVSHMGVHTGWMINQIDLTPNYSGTMIAIANCTTNFMVMIMPFLIANIIVDLENVFQWRIMMFLEAGIVMVPAVIFAVYISDDVQPWNDGNFSGSELKHMKLEAVEKNEELEKKVITKQ